VRTFQGPSASGSLHVILTRVRAVVLVRSFVRSPAPILAGLGALVAPLLGEPHQLRATVVAAGRRCIDSEIAETRALLRSVPPHVLAAGCARSPESMSRRNCGAPRAVLFVAGTRDVW